MLRDLTKSIFSVIGPVFLPWAAWRSLSCQPAMRDSTHSLLHHTPRASELSPNTCCSLCYHLPVKSWKSKDWVWSGTLSELVPRSLSLPNGPSSTEGRYLTSGDSLGLRQVRKLTRQLIPPHVSKRSCGIRPNRIFFSSAFPLGHYCVPRNDSQSHSRYAFWWVGLVQNFQYLEVWTYCPKPAGESESVSTQSRITSSVLFELKAVFQRVAEASTLQTILSALVNVRLERPTPLCCAPKPWNVFSICNGI